jgi:hypothetical protein
MTQRPYKVQGTTTHTPWAEDGKVFLSNDEDGYYIEEFKNHDELEAFVQQLRVTAQEAWLDTSSNITFNSQKEEVMRIDAEGFHYKGEFIADAGEAHRLTVAFLKQNTAQPEPEVPTDEELWELYDQRSGEPDDWPWIRDYARAVLALCKK